MYDYIEYILGEDVAHVTAKDEMGHPLVKPAFSLVLGYEFQVRTKQAALINEGNSFAPGLEDTRPDKDIRD